MRHSDTVCCLLLAFDFALLFCVCRRAHWPGSNWLISGANTSTTTERARDCFGQSCVLPQNKGRVPGSTIIFACECGHIYSLCSAWAQHDNACLIATQRFSAHRLDEYSHTNPHAKSHLIEIYSQIEKFQLLYYCPFVLSSNCWKSQRLVTKANTSAVKVPRDNFVCMNKWGSQFVASYIAKIFVLVTFNGVIILSQWLP
jgi:hypothetical protein